MLIVVLSVHTVFLLVIVSYSNDLPTALSCGCFNGQGSIQFKNRQSSHKHFKTSQLLNAVRALR